MLRRACNDPRLPLLRDYPYSATTPTPQLPLLRNYPYGVQQILGAGGMAQFCARKPSTLASWQVTAGVEQVQGLHDTAAPDTPAKST